MVNQSIKSAFERFWQHAVTKLDGCASTENLDAHIADVSNPHNTTKDQIGLGNVDNTADANKSVKYATSAGSSTSATKATQDASGNIIASTYETKTDANAKLTEAKTYTDTVAEGKADSDHNHDTKYDAKGAASSALDSAKTYADNAASAVKNDLLNGAGAAYDTLKELGDLIVDNADAIDALETIASGKADKTHSHAISDVSGLQTALDGKAASSHGTHVTFDSTNKPKMDGTAAFGTSTSVARADHVHPTDTSRASQADLDALETVVSGKASSSHTHAIADITNLQTTLDGKAASSHKHTVSQISDLTATATELNYMDGVTSNVQTQLDGKAASSHSHTITATATDDDVIVLTGTNGSNKVTFDAKHATSGVTAGTYKSVTVNAYGHVTGGTNPTTLAGFGITDAYTKTEVDAKTVVDSALSSTSTNPVQNKIVNSAISTATQAISANTQSIESHTQSIAALRSDLDSIVEITSAEIQSLFNS